jgi:hypothetical protein
MNTLKVKWTGVRPLLMHNGRLADPLDNFAKQMKELNKKRKKEDDDYLAMGDVELEGGLYWDDTHGAHVPSDNIERCIQLGAQKSKLGKDAQAAVLVSDEVVKLSYDGPKEKKKFLADERFRLRKSVAINNSRIVRVRPMFPSGWWIQFTIEHDSTIIGREALVRAMIDAGALVGLGDWRPKFGRFLVEVLN